MGVSSLLFRTGVDAKTRFQALLNFLCSVYMIVLVTLVTSLGFFHIVPWCYTENHLVAILHRMSIGYCLIGCISHYVTCIVTDPSVQSETKNDNLSYKKSESCNGRAQNVKHGIKVTSKINQPYCVADQIRLREKTSTVEIDPDSKPSTLSLKEESEKELFCTKGLQRNKSMFFCQPCKQLIPDRVHHCYLCETCITKRDHHCFFMCVCIGDNNQRYFIFFTLFMGLGTLYGLALITKYLHFFYKIQFFGPQTFVVLFVQTVMNVFTGRFPTSDFLLHFFCMYASLFGTLFAFSFFCWQIMIVYHGQTTYEAKQGISAHSKETARENFAEVFGNSHFRCIRSLVIPFVDLV